VITAPTGSTSGQTAKVRLPLVLLPVWQVPSSYSETKGHKAEHDSNVTTDVETPLDERQYMLLIRVKSDELGGAACVREREVSRTAKTSAMLGAKSIGDQRCGYKHGIDRVGQEVSSCHAQHELGWSSPEGIRASRREKRYISAGRMERKEAWDAHAAAEDLAKRRRARKVRKPVTQQSRDRLLGRPTCSGPAPFVP
jgi:hypothetical protein